MLRVIQTPEPRRRRFVVLTLIFIALTAAGLAGAQDQKRAFSEEELRTMQPPGPNPFLSNLPGGEEVDWDYWRAKVVFDSHLRAQRIRGQNELAPGQLGATEIEPNESQAGAQRFPNFGTGAGDNAVLDISASIGAPISPSTFPQPAEDNGAIGSAVPTGLASGQSVTTTGTIGDGPHGSGGTGRGDFDFFSISGVTAGQRLSIRVETPSPELDLDPNCAIWDSAGNLLAFHEDIGILPGDLNFDCSLVLEAPANGTYYLSIGAWGGGGSALVVLPGDPFDSGSGGGSTSEGAYSVTLGLDAVDRDCFSFELVPGDILGTNSMGDEIITAQVIDPSGQLRMVSTLDNSDSFPDSSPMPSGGIVTSFVAHEAGDHTVCFDGDPGAYTAGLRVFRPVLEETSGGQIFFIDFDGATLDRSIFGGGSELITLSPLSSFLTGWRLNLDDEDAVIDAIMARLEETMVQDLTQLSNPSFSIQLLNSRDHADPFGQPNVSRVIVGGTVMEAGIGYLYSRAQSVDPGNFDTEETAVVLLDLLSEPEGFVSLNIIEIADSSTKIDLVGTGVGNVIAHEVGHLLGNWHTETLETLSEPSLMDANDITRASVGVGADQIFGTADDIDVDFSEDTFQFPERLWGFQDAGEIAAHALTSNGVILIDGFESGNTQAWTVTIP